MRKLIAGLLTVAAAGSIALAGPSAAAGPKKPVSFKAEGSLQLPNPTDLMGYGITSTEFTAGCAVPANTQGVDGYVIELPKKVTQVNSVVYVEGAGPTGVNLIDMFFFTEDCSPLGEILGSDTGTPLMPRGTRYVLVTNWLGDPQTTFTFYANEQR